MTELLRVLMATAITGLFHIIGITVLINIISNEPGFVRMPFTYYLFGPMIQFLMLLAVRFSYRFILMERNRARRENDQTKAKRVMLIGAGNAGQMILHDAMRMKEDLMKVCCVIDDNPNKHGRFIEGVLVVGGRKDIIRNVEKYRIDQILLAIPSASAKDRLEILNICKETGCELKNLPGMYQLVSGKVSLSDMKDVAVEDLLGRDPIRVDMGQIFSQIANKTILITGGGGSIGSELC